MACLQRLVHAAEGLLGHDIRKDRAYVPLATP